MKRRWLVCSVVLLSLVLALPASALTNKLLNGDFEAPLGSEWYPRFGSTISRVTSPTHSGSGALQVIASPGSQACQCVSLDGWPAPDGTRRFAADGYLQSDGGTTVYMTVQSLSGSNCDGEQTGMASQITNAASWTQVVIPYRPFTVDTQSALICVGANGFVTFYADDLQFYPTGPNAVKLHMLAARHELWIAGLLGVAAVGVVLGRRRRTS